MDNQDNEKRVYDLEREPASLRVVKLIVALVVLLAASFAAYHLLAGSTVGQDSTASTPAASADAETADSSEGAAGPSASSGSTAEKGPQLAEHDSTVYTESGEARTLTQIADGKPLVMNFWATWCPYCIQEMDDYQDIYNEYGNRVSFAFIDVADGTRETVDGAAAWLRDNGYTLPAYYDTGREAQYAYGASALPTTVIVAADGEIRTISAGAIDPTWMRSRLDTLLEG